MTGTSLERFRAEWIGRATLFIVQACRKAAASGTAAGL
jgi:hypothetical protein